MGGEFEEIRGRYPDTARTKEYNDWLLEQGFSIATQFETYFEFDSEDEARKVIGSIWGEEVGDKVKNKNIEHKIVIYKKISA
jgi:hypothetical protein